MPLDIDVENHNYIIIRTRAKCDRSEQCREKQNQQQ